MSWILPLLFFVGVTYAVHPQELFTYSGKEEGEKYLDAADDASTPRPVRLTTPVKFLNKDYYDIYVNTNGLVSFERSLPYVDESSEGLPTDNALLAPWYADIDISEKGFIVYRETDDAGLLDKAEHLIRKNFKDTTRPKHLFIATWDSVPGHAQKQGDNGEKGNTFQVVIASTGYESYAFFLYADGGINWWSNDGKYSTGSEIFAKAGIMFDRDGVRSDWYHPFAGTPQIELIALYSTARTSGLYAYKIGGEGVSAIGLPLQEQPGSETAEENTPAPETTPEPRTTAAPKETHPPKDDAGEGEGSIFEVDGLIPSGGHGGDSNCQRCGPGQISIDGSCRSYTDMIISGSGTVHGSLNGADLGAARVQMSDIPAEGHANLVFAPVDEAVGEALAPLAPLASGLGFLFSKTHGQGTTGASWIGQGSVTHEVTMRFETGEQVTARVSVGYSGMDSQALKYTCDVQVDGTAPQVGQDQVQFDDFSEDFTREAQNKYVSSGRLFYKYRGQELYMDVQHTLHLRPQGGSCQVPSTIRVLSSSVNSGYLALYRGVTFSRRTSLDSERTDACTSQGLFCHVSASCVEQTAGQWECRCNAGYLGTGQECVDVDECQNGAARCSADATCQNAAGSYACRCNSGYQGDGYSCQKTGGGNTGTSHEEICARCHAHGQCVYDYDNNRPKCECLPGYDGDGEHCSPTGSGFTCLEVNNCNEYAQCVRGSSGRYECQCVDGFSGDGLSCEEEGGPDLNCKNCDPNAACAYDTNILQRRCVCSHGYTGDGYTCTPLTPGDCRYRDECDMNAECVEDASRRFYCRCRDGYYGDGRSCQKHPEDCRNAPHMCDRNAQCSADAAGNYNCYCMSGYRGDGKTCHKHDETSCSVACDPNADCVERQCRCRPGYAGNGVTCIRQEEPDCSHDQSMCSPHADCLPMSGRHVCQCRPGYRGDGRQCVRQDRPVSDYLIVAQGLSIVEVPLTEDGKSKARQLVYDPDLTIVGVDMECDDGTLFYSEVNEGVILKTSSNAGDDSESQDVILTGGKPEGVAVDWISDNLYWTDSHWDEIAVCKYDGSDKRTLVDSGLHNPRSIVLDPVQGYMYWSDWHRPAPKIEVAEMDGSNRRELVTTGIKLPNALALDIPSQMLCWADAGTNKVECMRTDGSGRRALAANVGYPFAMAQTANNFYVTDWKDHSSVKMYDRYTGEEGEAVTLPIPGHSRLYGVVAAKHTCPRGTNGCAYNNGECDYLCLPKANGHHVCECPDAGCNGVAKRKRNKKLRKMKKH